LLGWEEVEAVALIARKGLADDKVAGGGGVPRKLLPLGGLE
jgi:hypothetical protein